MIEIDGSFMEGGGQIVRTALALSLVYKKAFRITGIRAGRKQPGLKPQHLACIRLIRELSNSQADGAEQGSTELTFYPGNLNSRTVSLDVGTAGALTLLLQSVLLPLIHDPNRYRLRLRGGTDTRWSMPMDYFSEIVLPQLSRFADLTLTMERRGFYPKGGGRIDLLVKNKPMQKPLQLTIRHELVAIRGRAFAHTDLEKAQVAERMAKSARVHLTKHNVPIKIDLEYAQSDSVGCGIACFALFANEKGEVDSKDPIRLGADILGEPGVRSEEIGKRCADHLTKEIESGALVDQNCADNLIPYLMVYGGSISVSRITDHTRSNIYVCERFSKRRFRIEDDLISIDKEEV
jgi:RNA 3'-phosphate cyclase